MEMAMRRKVLIVLVVPLIAALTAQAATAAELHHTQMKGRAVEQFRNSNAYAAPGNISVQPGWSDYAEGAMTSGIAGQ
jgi:hypothetical protein